MLWQQFTLTMLELLHVYGWSKFNSWTYNGQTVTKFTYGTYYTDRVKNRAVSQNNWARAETMPLGNCTTHSTANINTSKSLNYKDKNSANNYVKQQLFTLLQFPQYYLNESLYLNTYLHPLRVHKRSSNCSTKNGNLGALPINV